MSTANLYALLIGINHYLPTSSGDPSLKGCVRDIQEVEEFLRRQFGLTDERLIKLTSTKGNTSSPVEPPEQQPTYENMVAAFKNLKELAQLGDQVYIHYSAHGRPVKTAYPQLKGTRGLDESLVPLDFSDPNSRYLRDVELAYLLKELVDKGLIVTVVLDSCHSGGATRGGGSNEEKFAVTRSIDNPDFAARPIESLVASTDELAAHWQTLSATTSGEFTRRSAWMLETQGYVLLAACGPQQLASEYPFNGKDKSGALTYWMLDVFKQYGTSITYKMLRELVSARVKAQFPRQTPELQGEGDRLVLSSDQVVILYAVTVIKSDKLNAKRILLNTGLAAGIRKGAQFAVYPAGTMDFTDVNRRLAVVTIVEVRAADSWAEISEILKKAPIEPGAQAILLDAGTNNLQRSVLLPSSVSAQAAESNPLDEAFNVRGVNNWIKKAAPDESPEFQVVINDAGEYEIRDSEGQAFNLRPALKVDSAESAQRLVNRLVHLTKYRNVQQLKNWDLTSPLTGRVKVSWLGMESDYDPSKPLDPQPFNDPGTIASLNDGQWDIPEREKPAPRGQVRSKHCLRNRHEFVARLGNLSNLSTGCRAFCDARSRTGVYAAAASEPAAWIFGRCLYHQGFCDIERNELSLARASAVRSNTAHRVEANQSQQSAGESFEKRCGYPDTITGTGLRQKCEQPVDNGTG